jgi:hypothetical protein
MPEITTNVNTTDWKEFLAVTPAARIYHTPEWQLFLEKTFPYKSCSIFSQDESGQITGMLPLFKIESRITGKRLISAPFSHICGPIGSPSTAIDLLNYARGIQEKEGCSTLEIRDWVNHPEFHVAVSFSTYICDLTPTLDELWKRCDKGSVRWAIKKATTEGVSVETPRSEEALRIFYELNALTKKNLGVPCHPWAFFRNLFIYLKDSVHLYTARYQGETIGGGIMIHFNKNALYAYGAAHPAYLKYHPYHAFIWKSIQDAHTLGYSSYDFGRTSSSDPGLADFKKRWCVTEQPLSYSYAPPDKIKGSDNRSSILFRLESLMLRNLPMTLYEQVSEKFFWNFG